MSYIRKILWILGICKLQSISNSLNAYLPTRVIWCCPLQNLLFMSPNLITKFIESCKILGQNFLTNLENRSPGNIRWVWKERGQCPLCLKSETKIVPFASPQSLLKLPCPRDWYNCSRGLHLETLLELSWVTSWHNPIKDLATAFSVLDADWKCSISVLRFLDGNTVHPIKTLYFEKLWIYRLYLHSS